MTKTVLLSLLAGICLPALCQSAPDAFSGLKDPAPAVLRAAKAKGEAVLKARAAHIEAGKNSKDFKGDVAKDVAAFAAQLATEGDPVLRQALIVSQLYLLRLGKATPGPDLLAATFKEVPPVFPGWALDKSLLLSLEDWAPELAGPYLVTARAGFPDAGVRAYLLFEYFTEMIDTRPEAQWRPAFEALQQSLPHSLEAQKATDRLAAERKTAVGELTPAFDVVALEDPTVHYTPGSFKGHYVLLDFWATWCPDCAVEMPALHAAYARFKGKGLEILSLSFDRKVTHIAPYRLRAATPMPWKHTFLEGAFKNPLSEAYGVKSIPKPVLVGPDSRIVATGGELHGPMLAKTLEKFLGQ